MDYLHEMFSQFQKVGIVFEMVFDFITQSCYIVLKIKLWLQQIGNLTCLLMNGAMITLQG